MKLEVGKRYVTRKGEVTSPLERSNIVGVSDDGYPFMAEVDSDLYTWTVDGCFYASTALCDRDLVEEYSEPVPDAPISSVDPVAEKLDVVIALLGVIAENVAKLANPPMIVKSPTNEELRDMTANSPRMTEKQIRSVRFKFPEEPGARHVVGSVQIRPVFQPGSYGMPDNLDKVAHRDIEKTTGIDNFLTATEVLAAQEAARKSPRTLGLDAYGPDVITPLTGVDVDRAHCEAGIHDGCDCLKPEKKESPELPWTVNWSPQAGQDPYALSVVTYHFGDDYCPQFPGHYVKHEPGSGCATIRPISDIYADIARYVVTE